MKKILLLLLCYCCIFSFTPKDKAHKTSETSLNDEDIAQVLLDSCQDAFLTYADENHFSDKNSDDFCNCFVEKINQLFSDKELISLFDVSNSNKNRADMAYDLFKKPKVEGVVMTCIQDLEFDSSSYMELNEEKEAMFIEACKDQLIVGMSDSEILELKNVLNTHEYCKCYVNSMVSRFSVSEMNNVHNNPTINNEFLRIQDQCMENNMY